MKKIHFFVKKWENSFFREEMGKIHFFVKKFNPQVEKMSDFLNFTDADEVWRFAAPMHPTHI